ncbi:MAG: GMC family oxidoreductase [Deltaproteobacteria bacterium]|nr:GMC family oxidoreductase [Deltaproteobacteria bacterium]
MRQEPTDVLIVGSGAGGSTLAYALTARGASVRILEKGSDHRLPDFLHKDEIKFARRNFFVPYPSDEPHMVRVGDEAVFRRSSEGWIANVVGGGTTHMGGFLLRLHPNDLLGRSKLGVPSGSTVEDWPLDFAELEVWYDRVEALLGVSGRAGDNPFEGPRSNPFPLPPLLEHPLAKPLEATAKKLGWHPFTTPRAVLSQPFDGRSSCSYSGFCGSYGCDTGAKGSVIYTVLPKAEATGKCQLVPNTMAAEILVDEKGRAKGVRSIDRDANERVDLARVVVLSASSVESARLLLASKSSLFPDGLANGSGLVGRNLTFSSFASVFADFHVGGKAKLSGLDNPLPWIGRSVQDFYEKSSKFSHRKGGTLRFDLIHPNPIFRAEHVAFAGADPLFGRELKAALAAHFHGMKTAECEVFAEFLPNPDTLVSLDPEVRDKFGLPVARIQVRQHPETVAATGALADKAAELFDAMQADSVRTETRSGITWVLQHGTCRFGRDPQTSVLDPNCRAHDVPNLFVVDGSFMPTSGGVPTTLTIQANALRVGEHLAGALVKKDL